MGDSFSISDSPNGTRSLTLKGDVSSKDRESLCGQQFANLLIRHGDHNQLDYLASSFETIRILDVGSEQFDWSSISRMPALARLSIGAYWAIPWRSFGNENLEALSFTWDKRYAVSDLQFPSLKHLKVIGWHDEGLNALTMLNGLTYLDLVDSRHLKILSSLKSLPFLATLRLRGAPKLTSLAGIESLRNIIALQLEGLKRLDDPAALNLLQSLRGLIIRGCAPIPSLSGLSVLPKLELLVIGDTKVEDGKLEVLKSFPSLRATMFRNKRGYDWTPAEAKDHFGRRTMDDPHYSGALSEAMKMRL